MKKNIIDRDDARDASLRVSKRVRDSLKAAAAVMGRPLYDVTNEAINNYLSWRSARGTASRALAQSRLEAPRMAGASRPAVPDRAGARRSVRLRSPKAAARGRLLQSS